MSQRPFSERMAQRQFRVAPGSGRSAGVFGGSKAAWAGGAIWLLAGLGAGYWLLQAGGQGPLVSLNGLAPSAPQADVAAVGRALGALPDAVAPAAQAGPVPPVRVRLLGVVAQGHLQGAALLAIDDQPPRPWRVGSEVADGLVLQSVDRSGVRLGEARWGPVTLEVKMPEAPAEVGAAGTPQ